MDTRRTILILLFSACLFTCKNKTEPEPEVPGRHLIMIKNHNDFMWIGMDDESDYQELKSENPTGSELWIGGAVVKYHELDHGFYFDPATITWGRITVEGMQTTIQQIKDDIEYFVNNGFTNGMAEYAWYVSCKIIQYQNYGKN